MANKQFLPYVGTSEEEVTRILQMYNPFITWQDMEILADYPMGDDYTFIRHYLRGGGGPFVEMMIYVDLGVGFSMQAINVDDFERAMEIKKVVDDWHKKINLQETFEIFGRYREIIGRGTLVKTYNLNGDFYFNKKEGITGVDPIDPTTLDMESVRKVMADREGVEKFIQNPPWNTNPSQLDLQQVELDQDRVIYSTRNPLSKRAIYGVSAFQNCLTDLRTLSKYPRYRSDMSRKFSNIHRIFRINTEILQGTEFGMQVLNDDKTAKRFVNDFNDLITEQEKKSANLTMYDFVEVIESTYAGKEPDITGIEQATLQSLGLKMEVPIELLINVANVNRNSLEVIADIFVKRREKGARMSVYAPLINEISNEYLEQLGYTEKVEATFNPFLSKDLNMVVQRMVALRNINAVNTQEIREEIDYSPLFKEEPPDENKPEPINPAKVPAFTPGEESPQGLPYQKVMLDGNKIRPIWDE